jgi:hypothetical protein
MGGGSSGMIGTGCAPAARAATARTTMTSRMREFTGATLVLERYLGTSPLAKLAKIARQFVALFASFARGSPTGSVPSGVWRRAGAGAPSIFLFTRRFRHLRMLAATAALA